MASIGVGNRFLGGEGFAGELQRDRGAVACALVGAAKKSSYDAAGTILFTQDPLGGSWVPIPIEMIESAEILGKVGVGGETCQPVRLSLEMPSHPSASVLAQLLDHGARVGSLPFRGDGPLPLRGDGTLPLRGDGALILRGDGTLPLRILEYIVLRGWGVSG